MRNDDASQIGGIEVENFKIIYKNIIIGKENLTLHKHVLKTEYSW